MSGNYEQLLVDAGIEIDRIKDWINTDKNKFDNKTKYLISYAVIRASGAIEVAVKEIIYDFLSDGVKFETSKYLENEILDSSTNPKTGNIANLLSLFSNEFQKEFNKRMNENSTTLKNDINSLVQLRNDFAHGKNINVSIDTVGKYFDSSKKVIDHLKEIISSS